MMDYLGSPYLLTNYSNLTSVVKVPETDAET